MIRAALFAACLPVAAMAEVTVTGAWVPLAPPGARAHAAYMQLANTGDTARDLIAVSAEGYGMTHIHQSMEHDGVAMMHAMDQITLAPGQTVTLEPGGLHIMLMMPMGAKPEGAVVPMVLGFADGTDISVEAVVTRADAGS